MYLSRIELAAGAAKNPAFWQIFRDGYRLHQAIWSLFGDHPDRRRDFLYRLDLKAGQPRILTLSERAPVSSELWQVEARPFAPALARGDRLRFSVRVNPVVTRQGKRHDVVMDAKTALAAQGVPAGERPPEAELMQEAGSRWLLARAEKLGVEVEPVALRADGYEVHRFGKRGSGVTLATLDLTGFVRVLDAETFVGHVVAGIGPAKGFGCGLMLLARGG